MIRPEDAEFLEHFGVKGMKWGVRNSSSGASGVSKRTDREASKDAKEFARAKMFYGTGAGTRRKLIKESVEAKRKKDPAYGKAFDKHLANQDLSKHVTKAKRERKSTDRKDRTKKRAGFLARNITGEMGTQAAFAAVVLGGAMYLNSPRGRQLMNTAVSKLKGASPSSRNRAQQAGADFLSDYFKRNA